MNEHDSLHICQGCGQAIPPDEYDGEFELCDECKAWAERTFKKLIMLFFNREETYWLNRVYDGADIGEGVDFEQKKPAVRLKGGDEQCHITPLASVADPI